MQILVVDPDREIAPAAEPLFTSNGWTTTVSDCRARAFAQAISAPPDVVVIQGDGAGGETAHLCQRFKHNPLTAGIPLLLVEDGIPPAWVLPHMPVDAVAAAPCDPTELVHQVQMLSPGNGTQLLDDLTNFPHRRSILDELERRLVTRELFAAGLLTLKASHDYEQDLGRTSLDQFVVLLSVLLRRNATATATVSIGHLSNDSFLLLGQPAVIHQVLATTTRDFEALVPAFYEMDALFDENEEVVGAPKWIVAQGALTLVEPGRFENTLQVGFALAEFLLAGQELAQPHAMAATPFEVNAA
ncbi:MAG: hypothetical protein M3462_12055 [Chloroflexota bacterium]|nr:hypothetical protein [Chloroflexota bacterium]